MPFRPIPERASPYAVTIGPGPSPVELLRRIADRDRPACLWGDWFDGRAVLTHSPLLLLGPEDDPIEVLDALPVVDNGFAGIGGGWLGSFGFTEGSSMLAFYDHLLIKQTVGDWVFESLGLDGREAAMRKVLEDWRELIGGDPPDRGRHAAQSGENVTCGRKGWQLGRFAGIRGAGETKQGYLAGVEGAIGHIHNGDFYQVNICTRLRADFAGDPLEVFADTVEELSPVYGGFIGDGDGALVSFSPELFLRVRDRHVQTAPIKGTAPRSEGETDSPTLRGSTKDAAENIMIVDLMRNDLSRVCRPGTVVVDSLLDLEAHPGVWHLVSRVSGELAPGVGPVQLLRATFPPGSVTGAPKTSATAGIAELEPVTRGAYTGAFGLVGPVQTQLGVVIRSFEFDPGHVQLGVGSGITVDSVPMLEWRECLHKAAPLVRALGSTLDAELSTPLVLPADHLLAAGIFETILVQDFVVRRLPQHLARLDRSCRELYGQGLPADLHVLVQAEASTDGPSRRRAIRVQAVPSSAGLVFDVSSRAIGARMQSCTVSLIERPVGVWRHKWCDRSELEAAERSTSSASPLFVAGHHRLLETSRGNIFVTRPDGVVVTPPLGDDLLPGVTRRAVLDLLPRLATEVVIGALTRADLESARTAFWTSSLSGAVVIEAIEAGPIPTDWELLGTINERLGFSDQLRSST